MERNTERQGMSASVDEIMACVERLRKARLAQNAADAAWGEAEKQRDVARKAFEAAHDEARSAHKALLAIVMADVPEPTSWRFPEFDRTLG